MSVFFSETGVGLEPGTPLLKSFLASEKGWINTLQAEQLRLLICPILKNPTSAPQIS